MSINKNIYAFDECSILKLCEIKIPNSHQKFFDKNILTARNHSKLKIIVEKLDNKNIPKFRFVPSENIQDNIIKTANQILDGYNIQMLKDTFKVEIIDQLDEFNEQIQKDFEEITKDDNINHIKEIFVSNERELKKDKNIPEDDDFKIISGYQKYSCNGNRYLITEDGHFWGYADLILDNFDIHIIKEWECHSISI